MMNEITLVPPAATTTEMHPHRESKPPIKEAIIINLPVEKRLPVPVKDIPVRDWIMPPEQHGYIQGNDKDCL